MSYEITIKKRRDVTKLAGKEWKVVGQEFDKDAERLKDTYGYTPEIERPVTEEVEVLKQTVDDIDLAAVIKAINKL